MTSRESFPHKWPTYDSEVRSPYRRDERPTIDDTFAATHTSTNADPTTADTTQDAEGGSTPSPSDLRHLVIVTDTKLYRSPDGLLRSDNPLLAPSEWVPFEKVFPRLTLITRVMPEIQDRQGFVIDEKRVRILPLPFFESLGYLAKRMAIGRLLRRSISDRNAYYCVWLPRRVSALAARRIRRLQSPLYARVIGDPYGVALSIFSGPLARPLAYIGRISMRRSVRRSDAVSYVTLRTLQQLYPASPGSLTLARCNVNLSGEMEKVQTKVYGDWDGHLSLVAVGSQERNYKGHDLLISAVAQLQQSGRNVSLSLVGSGAHHGDLVKQSEEQGVRNVRFIGHVGTPVDVARIVGAHDLFVMPSRTEGMPKALLEAMFIGVCAVGAKVGGIAELLEDDCLFAPNSAGAVANAIARFYDNPQSLPAKAREQRRMALDVRDHHSGTQVQEDFLKRWVRRHEG